MDIGYRIQAARQMLGLTRTELTKLAGISGGLLTNIEQGRNTPRVDTIAKIAEALHVSINWLIYGNHPPKADRELMTKLVLYEKRMEA